MRFRASLRNGLSPVLGVNRADPVLVWALRQQAWALGAGAWKHGVAAFLAGALTGACLLGLASALRLPLFDLALLMIVALRPLADLVALAGSWGRLGPEFRSGRWDALRLTAQTEGSLLRAHEAAAHARLWRLLWAALGAQTASLFMAALWLPAQARIDAAPVVAAAAVLSVPLALELLLRVRAMTTVGLALSAASSRAGTAVIFGGLALLLLWFVQVVMLVLGLLLASIGAGLLDLFTGRLGSVLLVPLFPALWLPVPHRFVQQVAQHGLANAVVRRDETL